MKARWERVKELFQGAVVLPEAERAPYLASACAGDEDLRLEVARLLAAEPKAAAFLECPGRPDVSDLLDHGPELAPGARLGRYSLQRIIASGGMGTVWEALQDRPKRTVALKTLHLGFASETRRQRFQLEAEVLGRLRHPGIAQIFEAGTHEDPTGSFPYFAMELIEDARDIVTFVTERELTRHARLGLFLGVCAAVHHGHQRGVVHRDLKPGNILVDPSGQPKVIDFGLARTTRLEHSVTTAQTAAGALMGTLLYMSPEQLDGDPEEVDTRSDVYSLGVLLYQLITGELPHDTEGLSIQRTITLLRGAEPRRPEGVPDDLVWVIFRALEKEADQRYASASELAADVRRFMNHEPVLAGPPSLAYRLKKSIRRNRIAVLTVTLVLVALGLGLAGVLAQARETRAEAAVAVRVNEFFDELLEAPTPHEQGRDVLMSEVLDVAALRIETEFPDRPDVQARIRASIGKAYQQLGRYEQAKPHLEVAMQAALSEFGEVHPTTAEAIQNYATSLRRSEEIQAAEAYYRQVVEIRTQLFGELHHETLGAKISLSTVLLDQGKNDQATAMIEELMETLPTEQSKPAQHVAVSILNNYTTVLVLSGELEGAVIHAEETIGYAAENLGEEDPYTLLVYAVYGNRLQAVGRNEEAEEIYLTTLELMRDTLGEHDFDLISLLNNLGQFLNALGRHAEGEPYTREAYHKAYAIRGRQLGYCRNGFVRSLLQTGGEEEAVALLRRDLVETDFEEDWPRIAEQLAQVLQRRGEEDEAADLRRRYAGG